VSSPSRARRQTKWGTETFAFRAGDTPVVRAFTETSPSARKQAAENWGRDMGYRLLGVATDKDIRESRRAT
jgi:hypothetical protein